MPDDLARVARDASRQLRRMPKELRRDMTRHVRDNVAEPLARAVAGSFTGPWSAVLAAATKARVQGDPTVAVAGTRPVVSGGASVRQLVYGAQWGGGARPTTQQFRKHNAETIYPTFRARADVTFAAWAEAVDPFLDEWAGGRA